MPLCKLLHTYWLAIVLLLIVCTCYWIKFMVTEHLSESNQFNYLFNPLIFNFHRQIFILHLFYGSMNSLNYFLFLEYKDKRKWKLNLWRPRNVCFCKFMDLCCWLSRQILAFYYENKWLKYYTFSSSANSITFTNCLLFKIFWFLWTLKIIFVE